MEKNLRFIQEMDTERVLAGFRRTAGIPTESETYGGWEDSLIAGHGVGHYFSALAMAIAVLRGEERDCTELEKKADAIVTGLRECQEKYGSGFLSAATIQDPDNTEIQFDALEGKADVQTWVPWYALHKVLQGLIDLWVYSSTAGAKEASLALADWTSERALSWDETTRKRVLSVEYGGMNDSLYQLYYLTKENKYLKAAQIFDEPSLYREFLSFRNRLKSVHANATIPKFLGYLRGYGADPDTRGEEISEETQKERRKEQAGRLDLCERFWDLVAIEQTYDTGGIGDMEHFFLDGRLDGSRTQCNAESCCCYNMMKLSQLLYLTTGEVQYLLYIEAALWNARLGSVGPEGGYTYFNPMATGYYRLYSPAHPKDNPFWCCVGTGLEDFAKAGDQIFYLDKDTITIAQWISSDLKLSDGTVLELRADYEEGRLTVALKGSSSRSREIRLRIPIWIRDREEILPCDEHFLSFTLRSGEEKSIGFAMDIYPLELSDSEEVFGLAYGPFVLCAPLGEEKWGISTGAGIEVYAPAWKVVFDAAVRSDIEYRRTNKAILDREYLTLPEGETIPGFRDNLEKYVRPLGNMRFRLEGFSDYKGEPLQLDFEPYYRMGNRRYGIYWYVQVPRNTGSPVSRSTMA
ncbi:MAG: glycoside hydrolase family 127 protein [Clostridiales bacterium]|nr:glycoside hydrolase family 127 protein [Clostridiales bacterium]